MRLALQRNSGSNVSTFYFCFFCVIAFSNSDQHIVGIKNPLEIKEKLSHKIMQDLKTGHYCFLNDWKSIWTHALLTCEISVLAAKNLVL